MPPSPGRIHDLPVKVLYDIDNGPQSFLTVLSDRQSVYVHPASSTTLPANQASGSRAPASSVSDSPLGSCYLKPVARGICFSSPECIPNATSLDFSVYNLDPQRTASSSRPRAFADKSDEGSWLGRGFLSWALSEAEQGKTLLKGRLVREREFSPANFPDEHGLEGLMAAASRAGGGGPSGPDDESGWGLEVSVSLKMVNPQGKTEFRGRQEFENMLAGRTGSSPRPTPASRTNGHGLNRPPAVSRSSGNTPISSAPFHQPSPPVAPAMAAARQQSFSTSSHLSLPQGRLALAHPPSRPSPSIAGSTPMAPSLSNSSIHSRQPSAEPRPPPPPPAVPAQSSRQASREVTPPPLPQPNSPPPSTPARAALKALLRSDGPLSPDVAKRMMNHPGLLRLMKAVPAGLVRPPQPNFAAVAQLAGQGLNGGTNGLNGDHKPSPLAIDTPTPASSSSATIRVTDGCMNCGTMESTIWRTRLGKDGVKHKVCDECGKYFNVHKRMRPPEIWNRPSQSGSNGTNVVPAKSEPEEKTVKLDHIMPHPPSPSPIRSSPRLHRHSSDQTNSIPPTHVGSHVGAGSQESPRKRARKAPPPPSPRMATRSSKVHEGVFDGGGRTEDKPAGGIAVASGSFGDFAFSPSAVFATSPVRGSQSLPDISQTGMVNGDIHHVSTEDVDLEQLLATFTNASQPEGELDLSAIFGTGEGNEAMSQEISDFLSQWEAGLASAAQAEGETTANGG